MLYIIEVKPLPDKEDRYILLFEELSVLMVACILPNFSGILDDDEMKWNLGWVIIAIIFANFFVNLIVIIKNMIKTIIKLYKLAKLKLI